MEPQKTAPWAMIAALAVGFSVGHWDGEKATERIQLNSNKNSDMGFYTAYVQHEGIAVLNTWTGEIYVFSSSTNGQWTKMPPIPTAKNPYDQFDPKPTQTQK